MVHSRSIGRARRSSFSPLVAGVALGALCAVSSTAQAQPLKIAVLPFNGPQGAKVAADVSKPLKGTYDVISNAAWDASSKKLVANTHSAEDIAAVAGDLGVVVVVTGAIKKDPGWTLVVTVRNGQNGKAVDKLRYDLRGSKITKATLKQVETELPPLIDKAQAPPTEGKPEDAGGETPTTGETPSTGGTENENPLAGGTTPPTETPSARPSWLPLVDPNVGLILGGRSFSFDQSPPLPGFSGGTGFGLRLDATLYPLALLVKDPANKVTNALGGLGIGFTWDNMFWADSTPQTQSADNCGTKPVPCSFSTSEYRFEVGLRWHWNVNAAEGKPELLAEVQYGIHDFSIEQKKDPTSGLLVDVGPPEVTYKYLTLGLGGRYPVHPLVSLLGQFNFHIVTDTGAIQSQQEYGSGGAYGLRFTVGGEAKVWKNLMLRAMFYYEYFGLSFDSNPNMPATKTVCSNGSCIPKSASDSFYGGIVTAGWQY